MDQYKNPSETTHTISEVMKWFKNNNIQYLSSLPLNFNLDDKLFEKKEIESGFNLFFEEFLQVINFKQIYEGGFFIIIGKKTK